ncbi:MAG: hypothetical protein WC758_04695 [Candidatus Woesearchaeota archaeon]|jgi:hypothetical protein
MNHKNKKRNLYLITVLFCILIIIIPVVLAAPPLPTEIYGVARLFNQPAGSGSVISVYDSSGNACGTYRMNVRGYFGVLTCRGEDDIAAGPLEDEVLSFKINDQIASAVVLQGIVDSSASDSNSSNTTKYGVYSRSDVTWETGSFKEIIIVAPPLICGDAYCDSYENCNTCTIDCGACPSSDQSSGGSGGGGAGSGSGGSGDGASGGGAGGSGGAGAGGGGNAAGGATSGSAADTGGAAGTPEPPSPCEESWSCEEWSACLSSGYQIRKCVDSNECGTSNNMPDIAQDCSYGENILTNETKFNQTVIPPRRERPGVISVCTERLQPWSWSSLIFFFLLAIIIVIAEIDFRRHIKRILSDKQLDELKKLELKYLEMRKMYVFLIVIILLAIVVYIYHYFFFICKDKYVQYLWMLGLGVILTPIVVHVVLALTKFSEKQKNKHLQILNDTHYKHICALLRIADEQLFNSEKGIVSKIYILEQKQEFNMFLLKDKSLSNIYGDMTKLFNLYKTLKNPMNIEKDLLENMKNLEKDMKFQELAEKYPELSSIRQDLGMLYSTYESKQGIYDELTKIEEEYGIKEKLIR